MNIGKRSQLQLIKRGKLIIWIHHLYFQPHYIKDTLPELVLELNVNREVQTCPWWTSFFKILGSIIPENCVLSSNSHWHSTMTSHMTWVKHCQLVHVIPPALHDGTRTTQCSDSVSHLAVGHIVPVSLVITRRSTFILHMNFTHEYIAIKCLPLRRIMKLLMMTGS